MKSLQTFKEFIDELNKDNGRLYKLEVLRKYSEDEDIKDYLYYVYNPFIITGISKKSIEKIKTLRTKAITDNQPSPQVKECLKWLNENNTGSNSVLEHMANTANSIAKYGNEDLVNLFYSVISKDLALGISVISINDIIVNLIPEFNVQLANKYFDKPEIVEGKTFALTTKIDGGRIIALKEDGKVSFYTRQGQIYEGLVDLEKEMMEKLPDNICLDGEITLLNSEGLSSKDQYKKTMKITRKDGEKHGVKMLVFDCMKAEEFRKQHCETPYLIRRGDLLAWFGQHYIEECLANDAEFDKYNFPRGWSERNDLEAYNEYMFKSRNHMIEFLNTKYVYFNILPILYEGKDTSKITEWLNYNINHGEEGVMINILNAPYNFKRTNDLLKVKKMQTLDLEITGYEEGDGKFSGMLGAFYVRYKDGNTVKVGSGISKALREEIWRNPESYIGKIIEVQYFEETTNQGGGISLRFPVFNDFRPDKLTPDF